MILDECLLVFTQSQVEPQPARISTRGRRGATTADKTPSHDQESPQAIIPIHAVDELTMITCIDAMPAMQTARRVRAPITMSARPRMPRARKITPPITAPVRKIQQPSLPPVAKRSRKPPTVTAEKIPRVRQQVATLTPVTLITSLSTVDLRMKEKALELVSGPIISEPVMPINTAIRAVLQATLDLGRPYDTNMLAATFGVSRSIVMQSLRKYYEDFVEQSLFTEAHFVPTYLWLYGLEGDRAAAERVVAAIKISGVAEPGSRSVFAIARDFVILYISEVVYGSESKAELTGLSSVASVMNSVKIPEAVPHSFVEITNSFLYRARMTGRNVIKNRPELVQSKGGIIGGLFS